MISSRKMKNNLLKLEMVCMNKTTVFALNLGIALIDTPFVYLKIYITLSSFGLFCLFLVKRVSRFASFISEIIERFRT